MSELPFHPNTRDIHFKQVEAAAFANTFDSAASKLEDFQGKIRVEAEKAGKEFKGKYGELFTANYNQCIDDAHRLAEACRRAAKAVRQIAHAAYIEQENRRKAREAEADKGNQGKINNGRGKDRVSSYYAKPAYVASEEPTIVVNSDASGDGNYIADNSLSRSAVMAADSGRSTGVSSADPEALEMYTLFVLGTLNPEMQQSFSAISTKYDSYLEDCQWGQLIIDGLLLATQEWLLDNENDADWINQVAYAFRKAGSDGSMSLADAALTESIKQAGLSSGRKKLHIPDVVVFGANPTSGYALDPVNVANGNFIEEEKDLSLGALSLVRMYNSMAAVGSKDAVDGYRAPSGAFGPGWYAVTDTHLAFTESGAVWVNREGRHIFFARSGAGFDRAAGEPWWLNRYSTSPVPTEKENCDTDAAAREKYAHAGYEAVTTLATQNSGEVATPDFFVVSNNTGVRHYYTLTGTWLGSWSGDISSTVAAVYEYANTGTEDLADTATVRLSAIMGSGNTRINLYYGPVFNSNDVRVVAASTAVHRVEYLYDTAGHLCSACTYNVAGENNSELGELVASRTYTHTEQHLITTVTGTGGVREVTNIYGDTEHLGRVTQQVTEHGRVVDYTYLPGGITQATTSKNKDFEENGTNSPCEQDIVQSHPNIWVSDESGRLVSVTSAEGARTWFAYDEFGNRIAGSGPDGVRVTRSADKRGRITRQITSSQAMVFTTYDAIDRPVRVETFSSRRAAVIDKEPPVQTITYEYAGDFSWQYATVNVDESLTRYMYTSAGKLASITDPTGVTTRFIYDDLGNLIQCLNAAGDTLTMGYDDCNRLVSVQLPSGATTWVSYDAASRPLQVVDPAGGATRYTYTPAGKIASVTDPLGAVTRYEYNPAGKLVAQVAADGARTTHKVDEYGYISAVEDPLGTVTRYIRDGMGRITQTIDPTGAVWGVSYNSEDTVIEQKDPTGVWHRYTKDNSTGVLQAYDATSASSITTDVLGRLVESINPAGGVTRWVYESAIPESQPFDAVAESSSPTTQSTILKDPVTQVPPADGRWAHNGTATHRVTTRIDAEGGEHREEYDAAGRLLAQISATGGKTTYVYDICGRLASVRDADGYVTEYAYDPDSRLIAKTRAGAQVESFSYDVCGRLKEHRQGGQLVGRYTYDPCGRVVQVTDSAWGTRKFSYDLCGRVKKAVSGVGGVCFFEYDAAGRLTVRRIASDDGFAVTKYSYDAVGNVTSITDPTGAVTRYTYDASGRCVGIQHPDLSQVNYVYDQAGQMVRMSTTRPGESIARLACEWVHDVPSRQTIVRDYLAGENICSTTGFPVETAYRYDRLGRLVQAARAPFMRKDAFTAIDRYGTNPAEEFAATGMYTVKYSYDADSRLVHQHTPYGSITLDYTPAGRVAHKIESTQNEYLTESLQQNSAEEARYSYDMLGYLTRVQVADRVMSWVRDATGFSLEYTEETSPVTNASAQTLRGLRVRRDEAGKVTQIEDTLSGLWCVYEYDASHQLIAAANSEGIRLVWAYNSAGLLTREEKHRDGALVQTRIFSYEGDRLQGVWVFKAPDTSDSQVPFPEKLDNFAGVVPRGFVCSGWVEYAYNERGFRIRAMSSDEASASWEWDVLGSLERVEIVNSHSATTDLLDVNRPNVRVKFANSAVRGVPVAVAGEGNIESSADTGWSPLLWEPSADLAPDLVGVGAGAVAASGPVLGGRDTILGSETSSFGSTSLGASIGHDFGVSVWGIPASVGWGGASVAGVEGVLGAVDFLPAGLGLSAQGALVSAGGELMGARVYDPVVGGFLAPDPLEPVAGAGWAGASCAFAGNDPVNLVDPTGLQPITVEQMKQYFDYVKSGQIRRDALNQFWEDIKRNAARFIPSTVEDLQKFWEDFWRDPVAWMNSHPKEMENTGLVIIATALLFTPAAPLAAGFLSEMGFSWLEQRWSEGKIDPTRLQIDGAIGAGSAGVLGLGARLYRGLRAGRHINFETSFGRASLKDGTAVAGAQRASRGSSVVEVPALFAQGSERQAAWSQLRQSRYPKVKVEVRPVTGAGARSAVEVPPVAVSRVDGSRVASVQGSGVSRGGSQVPLRPVEAPLVGEVPPASGVGAGAAGVQAVKPGGVADDAVVARGSAGGVRESGVSLRPVEEAKVEGLPPARGASAAEGPTVSMRDVQTHLDEKLEGVRRKEWRGKDKKGRPRTDYYDYNEFIAKEKNYKDAKSDLKEYNARKKQAELEGREFTEAPPEDPGPRPQHALWKGAEERFAPDLQTAMQLDEEGLKHHRVVRSEDYQGQIPQDTAEHLQQATQKIMKDGAPPHYPGANEARTFENHPAKGEGVGDILPTTDVEGNPITYTEMDFMAPQPKIGENGRVELKPNGKPETTRGDDRLIVGSNGSIYYSPDHYHTFILIVE